MKGCAYMSSLSLEIGQRIRNYRLQKKLSQEELAERCGLHPTYIGQVERGEKNATIESVSKISAGLEVSLSTLFENVESTGRPENNYPSQAYNLVQSLPLSTQEKLIGVLQQIIQLK